MKALAILAAALIGTAALTACSSASDAIPSPTTASSPADPSPSPTPTPEPEPLEKAVLTTANAGQTILLTVKGEALIDTEEFPSTVLARFPNENVKVNGIIINGKGAGAGTIEAIFENGSSLTWTLVFDKPQPVDAKVAVDSLNSSSDR